MSALCREWSLAIAASKRKAVISWRRIRRTGVAGLLFFYSPQKKNPAHGRVFRDTSDVSMRSGFLQVACRQFAALGDDVKTDALTVGQCVHAGAL
jgi:hypothetical protein